MHVIRSGLLTAWGSAWLAGRVAYDDAVDAIVGEETHRVVGLAEHSGPDGGSVPVPVGWLLTTLQARGENILRLVLPVAGDPRGLPGPGGFSTAALDAGEGVLGNGIGLVPDENDGSDPARAGADDVQWTVFAVPSTPPPAVSLAEADQALTEATRTAIDALTRLDVARWRPEVEQLARGVASPSDIPLPPGTAPRAVRLCDRATRLAAVLELAGADAPGGAVTAHEARERHEALRPLGETVRQAQVAAYNAAAYSG